MTTKEETAVGAFLSAMHDQGLDGAKVREAMLEVLGITAANAVSEPKGLFVDLIASHGPEFVAEMAAIEPVGINGLTESETSASMSVMGLSKPTVQPQAQGESYSERWYGSGEDRGWWIVRGGLVKREHVAFLGESVSPEEVSKVVAELNAAHPQATEPACKQLLQVTEGYKLVPVEPTQEMPDAVVTTLDDHLLGPDAEKQYREDWAAMLAAAPEHKP